MLSPEGRVVQCGNCWRSRMPGPEAANPRSAEPAGVENDSLGVVEAWAMTKISVAVPIISIPVRRCLASGAAVGGLSGTGRA